MRADTFNRTIVLSVFLALCAVCAVWGGTYTMAILAIAAQPVSNYIQVKGKGNGTQGNPI